MTNSVKVNEKDRIKKDTIDDSEKRLQNVLRSIVDSFKDYFISVGESIWGKRPKKIQFDEVSVARRIGQTGIQLVNVHFDTEFGGAEAGLAVKVFENKEKMKDSVKRLNFLTERLMPYQNLGIRTPSIIFSKAVIMIMEGIKGESFNRSTVPLVERYRTAGKALAALHGYEKHKVEKTKNEKMIPMVIENLPISSDGKTKLTRLFLARFDEVARINENAGSISFGDFHQGNLMFEVDLSKRPIAAVNLIDPEFLEFNSTTDRLEDIANFFSHKAIQEWNDKGKFFQLPRDLNAFIAGYNEVLSYNSAAFFDYYFENPPINFHLALRILFSILNLASMEVSASYFEEQTRKRIQLSRYLLEECKPLIKDGTVF